MNPLQALVLGLLQGATEFLPVSSSGHLVLVPWILNWPAPGLLFDVAAHVGTLVAVVLYFWRDILLMLRGLWELVSTRRADTPSSHLALMVALASIPAALLGFLFNDLVESLFSAPMIVSLFLALTGSILMISERLGQRRREMPSITARDALILGVAQGLAIAPGISRSGATIAAGLLRGLERPAAARFSFLMSIPVVLGAAAFQMLKVVGIQGATIDWTPIGLGFGAALVSGYLAIHLFLRLLRNHSLRPFALYCWAIAALGIALNLAR